MKEANLKGALRTRKRLEPKLPTPPDPVGDHDGGPTAHFILLKGLHANSGGIPDPGVEAHLVLPSLQQEYPTGHPSLGQIPRSQAGVHQLLQPAHQGLLQGLVDQRFPAPRPIRRRHVQEGGKSDPVRLREIPDVEVGVLPLLDGVWQMDFGEDGALRID